ncbi:MAG TPA: LysM peptidoglycan-binding domain-containing protein [Flavobacterium sp.]|jgi:membrane-bound lytic murein transglycosylase D
MNLKYATLSLLLAVSGVTYSQEAIQKDPFQLPEQKLSYLDSIKSTFVRDHIASCVDSLWMKELTSTDIYDNLSADIKNINIDQKVDYELSTELLKERLREMDAKSPFNIEYNVGLENVIKSFLKNRKKAFERLMAVSEYYFPTFEEALAKQNVPLEIKYLAVVESALNPKAVSRVGATGLWQFMYQTGKQYNLHIDSYVDERSDPLKASAAAAQYMTNMYRIFGDWDLVLASYNSGPGNVAKAIRRSGGQQNYWNIRKHLPQETQGYLPAFLATMYIYEYHKEHGIVPQRAMVKHFETDTIMIRQQLTFKQISDLIDIPVAQLQMLNPSYKMNTVPAYFKKAHYLRLPADKIAMFTSNEEKIYAYANYELSKRERPYTASQRAIAAKDSASSHPSETKIVTRTKYYKVRRGDSLGEVASKYGVSQSSIKKSNKLKSNILKAGQSLKIVTRESIAVKTSKTETKSDIASAEVKEIKKNPDTASAKADHYYVVQAGDNLSNIAKKFNVSVEDLKEWNDISDNNVQLQSKLKIADLIKGNNEVANNSPEPKYKTEEYIVAKGDNLGVIAKRFNMSVDELKNLNGIRDNNILVGKKLVVSKKEITQNTIAETKTKKAAAKKSTDYYVRKGDSLFSIAQKYPGVTISDIKKWNGISGNNLKPGMRLKING